MVTKTNKVRFGYFSEWSIYQREFSVSQIPADKLSHVCYAFVLPQLSQEDKNKLQFPPVPYDPSIPEGTLVHHDGHAAQQLIPQLQNLKKQYPHLKVGLSAGGWTLSINFSKVMGNPTLRRRFVKSSVDMTLKYGFDFFDVDWEYPGKKGMHYNVVSPNDPEYAYLMLKELREEFDKRSPNKYIELTVASGVAVVQNYKKSVPYLDYILLMNYDVAGYGWAVGNHSPLYLNPKNKDTPASFTVDGSVKNALKSGFKRSQIVVGSPMYGRGWSKVTPYDPSIPIFGTPSGPAPASLSGDAGEPALSSWRHMYEEFKKPEWKVYWDNVEKAPYAINQRTGVVWTFENPRSAREKAKYVVDNNLAGMIFWEVSDDTRGNLKNNPETNLLSAVNNYFAKYSPGTVKPPSPPTTPPSPPTTSPPTTPPSPPTTSPPTPSVPGVGDWVCKARDDTKWAPTTDAWCVSNCLRDGQSNNNTNSCYYDDGPNTNGLHCQCIQKGSTPTPPTIPSIPDKEPMGLPMWLIAIIIALVIFTIGVGIFITMKMGKPKRYKKLV